MKRIVNVWPYFFSDLRLTLQLLVAEKARTAIDKDNADTYEGPLIRGLVMPLTQPDVISKWV